jgi:hypothetical protein
MAHYLVRATPKDNLDDLKAKLDNEDIAKRRPYGGEMQQALERARRTENGDAIWEEQCFCTPPLAQEREVLDVYFENLTTERLAAGEGWQQIDALPSLWDDAE